MALSLSTPLVSVFAPPAVLRAAPRAATSPISMAVADMEGTGPETGGGMWDPLKLSSQGGDKTIAWFRHAELKHGRVAMLAWLGFFYMSLPTDVAPLFQGPIELGGKTFESLGRDPFAAWDSLSTLGKAQIILVMGAFEGFSENTKPHYMSGGTPGSYTLRGTKLFDPFNQLDKLSAETRKTKRVSELKNGRLAMIGVMSVFAAHSIPDSVPAFKGALW